MYLELEENALDSLKHGLDYYHKFLVLEEKYWNNNATYLKMALLMIHNATELFIKKVLSNINELLVYKDLSNENFLGIYSYKINDDKDVPLDYFMTGDDYSIHTVDYTTLIKRMNILCDLSNKEYMNLLWLGKFRNKVNHFGIDLTIDYYRVLTVINSALNILIGIVYEKLHTDRNDSKILDCVYNQIQDILEIGEKEEEEAWGAFYSDNFVDLNAYIENLKDDTNFNEFLQDKGYDLEIVQGKYVDCTWLMINLKNRNEEKSEYIRIQNDPFYDVTLFVGELTQGPVYFVLNHSEYLLYKDNAKCFYSYNMPTFVSNIDDPTSNFWELDRKNKLCQVTEFSYNQLIRGLKKILK